MRRAARRWRWTSRRGQRRSEHEAGDADGQGFGGYPGEGVVRGGEVGQDHARRGTYKGTGEGVEQAVHPGRHASPARDLRAARREDPLPDVLSDHQSEEEKQEVGEDSLPPDGGEIEIGFG